MNTTQNGIILSWIMFLTDYETERKNGSQSSNLYIFKRFPKNEPPKAETLNHLIKTSNQLILIVEHFELHFLFLYLLSSVVLFKIYPSLRPFTF
ncbi:hypothetical protein BTR25_19715 [Bacillus sp. MRMR6]|nr:hypothetical protein BTR25_19715 [Bacillus sp. MRMR6]